MEVKIVQIYDKHICIVIWLLFYVIKIKINTRPACEQGAEAGVKRIILGSRTTPLSIK